MDFKKLTKINSYTSYNFHAHRIGISEILPWDRKSYLTIVILARLSREGCTLGTSPIDLIFMLK